MAKSCKLGPFRTEKLTPPEFYRPDAFRSSDHDPVLLGLNLR